MALQHTTSKLQGTDAELLHIGEEPTKLFLLFGDKFDASQCFKSGDLSVHMITVTGSPVAIVSCMVGNHQWMLAKDSMVLRVAPQAFVLALPGFLYGLTLPSACSHHGKKLEGILKRFSSYQDLLTRGESDLEELGTETDLWRLAYSRIERLARAAGNSFVGSIGDISLMRRKHQRALRISLLVKLVSRNLLSGVLSPLNHVCLAVAPGGKEPDTHGLYVLPSMWAFADLLDAMETDSLLALPLPAVAVAPIGPNGRWYFNKEGRILLLELVKAQVPGNLKGIKKLRLDVVAEEAAAKTDGGEVMISGKALEME